MSSEELYELRAALDRYVYGSPDADSPWDQLQLAAVLVDLVQDRLSAAHAAGAPFELPDWLAEFFAYTQPMGPSRASPSLRAWAERRARARGALYEASSPVSTAQGAPQVYVVYRRRDEAVKIGFSHNPASRLQNLRTASGEDLVLVACQPGTLEDERAAHARFRGCHLSGEWFQLTDHVRAFIREMGGSIA